MFINIKKRLQIEGGSLVDIYKGEVNDWACMQSSPLIAAFFFPSNFVRAPICCSTARDG
jgi:hypothetical protein